MKLTPVIDRLLTAGVTPCDSLVRQLADGTGATVINDALRDAYRAGVDWSHPVLRVLRDRARLLGATAAHGQRVARETIADRTDATRRGHGMRLGPTCGNPRAVQCEDPRNPLALATVGAVVRDLLPEDPRAIARAKAQAKADRAVSNLFGRAPRKRGGRRRKKRTAPPTV